MSSKFFSSILFSYNSTQVRDPKTESKVETCMKRIVGRKLSSYQQLWERLRKQNSIKGELCCKCCFYMGHKRSPERALMPEWPLNCATILLVGLCFYNPLSINPWKRGLRVNVFSVGGGLGGEEDGPVVNTPSTWRMWPSVLQTLKKSQRHEQIGRCPLHQLM